MNLNPLVGCTFSIRADQLEKLKELKQLTRLSMSKIVVEVLEDNLDKLLEQQRQIRATHK